MAESLLEPKLLRAFCAVAETLSFTQAAKRVGVAQQSLSIQIARLERDVGTRLFARSTRSVRLTAPGRRLYTDARDILDRLESAQRNVALAARGELGSLTIGCGGFAAETVLPQILTRFRKSHPGVAVMLFEGHSAGQIDALRRGEIDAGLTLLPADHEGLNAELIFQDGFSVAVAEPNAPGRAPLPLAFFRDSPFLAGPRSQSPGLDVVKAELFREAGFVPNVVQIASSSATLFALVAGQIGVMLTPGTSSRIAQAGVVFVPLQSRRRAELYLVTRREPPSAALRNFCGAVRAVAQHI